MANREQKEQKLREAVKRSILLSPEDKKFWIDHAAMLPNPVLDDVYKLIQSKNEVVDNYLMAALEKDKEHKYLLELKQKIQNIKQKAFEMEEEATHENAEDILKKELDNL
jgi:hypothetical protein